MERNRLSGWKPPRYDHWEPEHRTPSPVTVNRRVGRVNDGVLPPLFALTDRQDQDIGGGRKPSPMSFDFDSDSSRRAARPDRPSKDSDFKCDLYYDDIPDSDDFWDWSTRQQYGILGQAEYELVEEQWGSS